MKAIFAEVANIKVLPSRGIARLEIDFPIEHFANATPLFYGQRVLVTVSDLNMPFGLFDSIPATEPEEAPTAQAVQTVEPTKGGVLARNAAMICANPVFRAFVACDAGQSVKEVSEIYAAEYVRQRCGIKSRAELDHNAEAKQLFAALMRDFSEWNRGGV